MSPSPSKSDTTAFTNALKQVYYTHKNIVADLSARLDAVSDEYSKLKKDLKSPNRSEKCSSCAHLEEMNRTLQEHFNSLLREKDATIKYWEAKVQALTAGSTGLQTEACASQNNRRMRPHTDTLTDQSKRTSSTKSLQVTDNNPISPQEMDRASHKTKEEVELNSLEDSNEGETARDNPDVDTSKGHSRLRLTRQGKKRSRYFEEVSNPKRARIHSAAPDEDLKTAEQNLSTQEQKKAASTKLNNIVLVPETENTVQEIIKQKPAHPRNDFSDGMNTGDGDVSHCKQMLTVPETLAMDYSSNSDDEDDTVKENNECKAGDRTREVRANLEDEINNGSASFSDSVCGTDGASNEKAKHIGTEDTLKTLSQVLNKKIYGVVENDDDEDEDILVNPASQQKRDSEVTRICRNIATSDESVKLHSQGKKPSDCSVSPQKSHNANRHKDQSISEASRLSGKNFQNSERFCSTPEQKSLHKESPKNVGGLCVHSESSKPVSLVSAAAKESPQLNGNITVTTPGSISPRIFDDPKVIVKADTSTPKKRTKSLFRNRQAVSGSDVIFSNEQDQPSMRDVRLRNNDENSPSGKVFRQATLTQAFSSRDGLQSKDEERKKSVADLEEEEKRQMEEAIRRSLTDIGNHQNTPKKSSVTIVEPEFRIPQSPPSWKSPHSKYSVRNSPRKAGGNEKSPVKEFGVKGNNQNATKSPSQFSPHSSKPRDQSPLTHSSSHHKLNSGTDSARKGLFKNTSESSQKYTENDSQIPADTSQKGQSLVPQYSMSMCSGTPLELRVWNLQNTESESLKSPRRNGRIHGRQSLNRDSQEGRGVKEMSRAVSFDPNGSLNPDIRLSEYLHSQNVTQKQNYRNQSFPGGQMIHLDTLDETVAPNLISQYTENTGTPTKKSCRRDKTESSSQYSKLPGKRGTPVKGSGERNLISSFDKKKAELRPQTEETDEWWKDEKRKEEKKEEEDDNLVFSDGEDENETIAPSPQQSLLNGSQPHCSIPSSSRSFKFVHKQPRQVSKSSFGAGKSSVNAHAMGAPAVNVKVVDAKGDTFHEICEDLSSDHNLSGENNTDPDHAEESTKAVKQEIPLQSLCDSFDRVPREKELELPHVEVVRKKSERDKLDGFSCKQCYEYYKHSGLSEEAMRQKMKECSRHRERYRPTSTPDHFWSLGFPDTAELSMRGRTCHSSDSPAAAERAPRRRKRLEKKF